MGTFPYKGSVFEVSMLVDWDPPTLQPLTGVKASVLVVWEKDRTWSNIIPIIPAVIGAYDHVKAKCNGRFLEAIALQS